MNALSRVDSTGMDSWDTLSAQRTGADFCVSETSGDFRHSSLTEDALRFFGIILVLGALVQWSFPNASFAGDPLASKSLLSVAFAVVGMAAYRFAIRGHRSEMRLDRKKKELILSALNRRDLKKGTRRIALRDIKSIYVGRTDMPMGKAALRVRLKTHSKEVIALRGDLDEVQSAHALLCRDIRAVQRPHR